ncbi:ferredoxin reductase [Streptomyces pseudovenezuelae]|uniref:Ferredoxin-NADP reductase n=1 Tax=Streptomyces pseudovenezuelae TaxID=67350 RepID=A0ABT6LNL6_9ACTN|nr:ferredoxin reductase [Streptomyces pseudovenezuelae]MDH6217895.1 ferredoxin-NADP reductase [Streptomyces pseudovenezuelae]
MTTAVFRPVQAVYELSHPAFEEYRALDTVVHAISRASRSGASRMYDLRPADPSVPLPAFEAGAHIDVHIGPSLVRQHSLLNSPHEQGRYLICVRRDDTGRGGSTAVHRDITVGQRLRVSAPHNHFPLIAAERHVLVAGGIGITPLLSMAEELASAGGDFTLHHYAASERDAPLLDRVEAANFADRVVVHHSQTGDSVRAGLPADLRTPVPSALVYICGPDGFMTYVTEQATAAGWLPRQLHLERFGVPLTRP